jgi:hypothetical protein
MWTGRSPRRKEGKKCFSLHLCRSLIPHKHPIRTARRFWPDLAWDRCIPEPRKRPRKTTNKRQGKEQEKENKINTRSAAEQRTHTLFINVPLVGQTEGTVDRLVLSTKHTTHESSGAAIFPRSVTANVKVCLAPLPRQTEHSLASIINHFGRLTSQGFSLYGGRGVSRRGSIHSTLSTDRSITRPLTRAKYFRCTRQSYGFSPTLSHTPG